MEVFQKDHVTLRGSMKSPQNRSLGMSLHNTDPQVRPQGEPVQ